MKFVSRNRDDTKFQLPIRGIGSTVSFGEIERPVLPRAIKELGHSGYWGGMTLDRSDLTTRRVDSTSFDVAIRRVRAFQRYTKMSRFLLSKRKVFVADARDFDITPIRG